MKKILTICILGSCFCLQASADSMLENEIGIGYSQVELDKIGGDFTGFKVMGKRKLSDNFYLAGQYEKDTDRDLSQQFSNLNLGYYSSITDSIDWYLEAGVAVVGLQRMAAGDFKDTGYRVALGIDSNLMDDLAFRFGYEKVDVGTVDNTYGDYSEGAILLKLSYSINDSFSLFGDYAKGDSQNNASFGINYQF